MTRREEQLAEGLPAVLGPVRLRFPEGGESVTGYGKELLAALLPLVDRLCAEAAAEALTDAADATGAIVSGDDVREVIRARAAALTETKETDRG